MIKSMTGFGRCEIVEETKKITVELKAVNHRYCEMSVRMPKKLNYLEASVRSRLKKYISRGKLDIFITYEDTAEGKSCVKYNEELAREYFGYLQKIKETFGLNDEISTSSIARFQDVLSVEEQTDDEKELEELLNKAIDGAAAQLVETRIAEGKQLEEDILSKLDDMLGKVAFVEKRSPDIVAAYRKKIMDKVAELLGDNKIDETILATELTIFADKICVDEETVRLKAHINSVKETFKAGENIGRKLDFIAQEMNREANTIMSKANDLEVTNCAIDLKTEIEKIREQIQNIE